ncbi:MAG: hypothetical protein KKG00_08140, partial [Bacteroidetes bacterium]|nr:hypothetical protein [Bacteroidota bacterium]
TIDELTISNNDIATDLRYLEIELEDDFKILSNKVSGMPERYQYTEIVLSQKDINIILNKIKGSANFKSFLNLNDLLRNEEFSEISDTIFNVRYLEYYKRERYLDIDNISTRLTLTLNNRSNILRYSRIED